MKSSGRTSEGYSERNIQRVERRDKRLCKSVWLSVYAFFTSALCCCLVVGATVQMIVTNTWQDKTSPSWLIILTIVIASIGTIITAWNLWKSCADRRSTTAILESAATDPTQPLLPMTDLRRTKI